MIPFNDAIQFWHHKKEGDYYFLKLSGGYEIVVEPLLCDGQMYLGIYKNGELVVPKLVIKKGT